MRLFERIEHILLTAWVGGLWAIGYLAAPVLFKTLEDRRLAGELAGHMFQIIAIVGLICGALLLFGAIRRHGKQWATAWRVWVLIAMLALVAIGLFVLQPMIQEVKALGITEGSDAARRFGMLHGAASILYLLTSLGGFALVAFGLASSARPTSVAAS